MQKTAVDMATGDWRSGVCASDLEERRVEERRVEVEKWRRGEGEERRRGGEEKGRRGEGEQSNRVGTGRSGERGSDPLGSLAFVLAAIFFLTFASGKQRQE